MVDREERLTSEEKQTNALKKRFLQHMKQWYAGYQDEDFADKNYEFFFCVEDAPYEVWRIEFSRHQKPINQDKNLPKRNIARPEIWLLWNGKEVHSFEDGEGAFVDFINMKKQRIIDAKFKYFTSPLAISALLALLMLSLIAFLQIYQDNVPQPLWTVFTAVVSFYFGRGNSSHNVSKSGDA